MSQNILLCNEETNSEEINSFMYRAFLGKYQAFFIIRKIELLTLEKQETLKNLINILFNNNKEKEMKSCFAFA